MEAEVSALKAAFSFNNDWFEYSTIVVLGGLVFELVTLLAFHKTASWREKAVLIAGTLVIALGVAGEWHFGSKASAAALRLQAISDEKVAALAKDTAGAKKDAATAGAQIAEANARSLEAQTALAKFKAPRVLIAGQQLNVTAKIARFAGQKFDMGVNAGEPEAGYLLDAIEAAMNHAGWQQIDWKGGDIVYTRPDHRVVGIVSMIGVFAQMDRDKVSEFGDAAVALIEALKAEGIEAKAEPGSGTHAENKDAIHIIIGKKP